MEANQKRVCSKCGRELPLDSFPKGSGKDGRIAYCRDCKNKIARESRRRKQLGTPTLNPS